MAEPRQSFHLHAILLAVSLFSASPATAEDTLQAQFGLEGYRLFCAGCHGADGTGNRELERALNLGLIDLTTIARRNGGVFPSRAIAAAIAGASSEIAGHSALEMPPWAETFAGEFERFAPPPAIRNLVDRRIAHIVAYLRSIQR